MLNQKGAVPLLILIAVIGVVAVISIVNFAPFKNTLLSSLFPKSSSHAASPTDWPQFQHDAQHTGRSTVAVGPNYTASWIWLDKNHIVKNFVNGVNKSINDNFSDKATFKSNVVFAGQMQPISANGKVFFGAMNGILYAVNSTTGDNLWDFTTNGPILATAAYDSGVVVVPSMDGKIYGLNETDGSLKWSFQTGGGISAPAIIQSSVVYSGSRDGSFYALDLLTGALKWKYDTRDPNNSAFSKAPIIAPPALSEDGATVMFGAENMDFYALNTSNGTEKWAPKKLVGQSFLYSWPVVKGNIVIMRTMSSLQGAEQREIPEFENLLAGLSADPVWSSEEKTAVLNYLNQNPDQKSIYVFDITTGTEPYQVAMGRVSGENFTPFPPAVDSLDRILTYWRSKKATFLQDGPVFGSNYDPDISAMDPATGDRIKITNSQANGAKLGPELDNGYLLTTGGNYLYMANHFRGVVVINMTTGALTRITTAIAHWDCGDFRGWGYQIIYYGNDNASTSQCNPSPPTPVPPQIYHDATGWSGAAISQTGTNKMMYVTETNINAIAGIKGQ